MKHGAVTVKIHHKAGMTAANTINMEQRGPVDFNAFQGSTFKHRKIPKKLDHEKVVKRDVEIHRQIPIHLNAVVRKFG